MKRVGIHQINYFPWIGYFNKMAKSDIFVYLDEVQLADRGYSQRTPVVTSEGKEAYLSVSVIKRGHRKKKFSEICINYQTDWVERQNNFLKGNYSKHPFYSEVKREIDNYFISMHQVNTLMEVTLSSINMIRTFFGITTPTVMQSSLKYDRTAQKNDLMLELSKSCKGDIYLSGNGARKYNDVFRFNQSGVDVQYLTFTPFFYQQFHLKDFVPGLSVLDMLFNMGIAESKRLFWENLQENEKIEHVYCTK